MKIDEAREYLADNGLELSRDAFRALRDRHEIPFIAGRGSCGHRYPRPGLDEFLRRQAAEAEDTRRKNARCVHKPRKRRNDSGGDIR